MALIPTTILTGFLGAGKTTLLNRILHEQHGMRIAVIENEFGPENIDNDILLQNNSEQIVDMNNGCICCTVRGDLIVGLTSLADRRAAGELQFDRVIIETTGLANPGPVAQTFFIDDGVASHYLLDAIITVVDARHAMQQLTDHEEAQRQIGFADRILISKTDLVDADALAHLTQRITNINPRAAIGTSRFGETAIADILDIRGFNLNDKLDLDPAFLGEGTSKGNTNANANAGGEDHAHQNEHEHRQGHQQEHKHDCDDVTHDHHHPHHSDDIKAFVFTTERPFDSARLDEFLGGIVQVYGPRMLRYKGVLAMNGSDHKIFFQGVHQIMGSDVGPVWTANLPRNSKMVFIGKNLPEDIFIRGLEQCLV